MARKELGLERVGMVEVDAVALLGREAVEVAVVRVVGDPLDAVAADAVVDRARDGGLSRSGSTRDADDDRDFQDCSSSSASVTKSEGSSAPQVLHTAWMSFPLSNSN